MLLREGHRIVALEEDRPPEPDGRGRGTGPGRGHDRRGGDGSEEHAARDAGVGNKRHGALCSCEMVRACAWLAIVVGVSAGAIARQDDPAGPRLTEVYQAGEAGYHTFRIPSLIAARNGTLLAFAEARREGAADAGDIDLVVKRSRDGGRTWSPAQVVGDNGPNTFGNPCPVLDRTTGTIWLLPRRTAASIASGTSSRARARAHAPSGC